MDSPRITIAVLKERHANIIEMYVDGVSYAEIGRRLGISTVTARRTAIRLNKIAGLEPRARYARGRLECLLPAPLNPDRDAKLISLYNSGLSYSAIGRTIHSSPANVRKMLLRLYRRGQVKLRNKHLRSLPALTDAK